MILATCSKCGNDWSPFGQDLMITPITSTVTCPKCNFKEEMTWSDPETKKLKHQQQLGLIPNNSELELLKQKFSLLEQKLALEEQKRSSVESELKILKDWSFHRENDFRRIEDMAKEIEADDKFREEHK